HLVGEPRRVPELDGHPMVPREGPEGAGQGVDVDLQGRWELQQHRPQLRAEPLEPAGQPVHRFGGLPEATNVREIAAGLDRHDEVVGSPRRPVGEGTAFGEAVEGAVGLHGGEPVGVVLEPMGLGYVSGIEGGAPVVVQPTRRADVNRHRRHPKGGSPPPGTREPPEETPVSAQPVDQIADGSSRSSKVTGASKAARRAARRKMASMAGPTRRMRTKLVTARPVSQPRDVVPSNTRYRWTLVASEPPGR